MSEWKEYMLRDVSLRITSGGTPKSSEPKYYDGEIPWLNTKEIHFNYIRSTERNITELGLQNSSAKWIPKDSVIVAMYGATAAKVAYSLIDLTTNQACCNIIVDASKADCRYVYYYLQSSYDELSNLACGAAQQNLSIGVISDFPILIPSLDEQKRIAGVLSSLDDMIDLLHRENATLEAIAETLFRHYFIENPNPEWKESPLSTIATFLNGLACQKYPPKDLINRLPVLKIKELSSGITKDSDWATTDVGEEYIVHCGDVIFAWSASLMVKMWNGEDCVLNQHLFKVTSDIFPRWYYYLWCKYHLQEFISIAQSHATTMGHIKRGDLDSAMVLVPSRNEMESFTKQIEPLLKRVETNHSQINNLSFYRDNLLLRLMSGEVKIIEQ